MPLVRGYTAGHFAVELDGAHVGFASSVSGGESFAEVITEPFVDGTVDKRLGPRHFEPISVEGGLSMGPAWFDAIDRMISGTGTALDGAIVMLDRNNMVVRRLEWEAGLITEVGFPQADAAVGKSAANLRVVIRPEATSLVPGSGAFSGGVSPAAKKWLPNNFRFAVSGLESACARVTKVSAVTLRRDGAGVLTVDDLECTVPTLDAAPFRAWFDDLVDGTDGERTGSLTFLDPSLKNELARVELRGLGAFRVVDERQEVGVEAIARARVQMYCEEVSWTRPGKPEPEAAAARRFKEPEKERAPVSQPEVERMAAALLDVLGAPTRTPPVKEAIAARLLGSAGVTPTETARERGLAAGRAWAGDEARLDELEDLAGVAERDEWSALALGEDHSLRVFLAAQGEIAADESAVGDLARDDFTTGVLVGIAEVHREVAPLIERPRPPVG